MPAPSHHVFWICGLSGAGKSTLAAALVGRLRAASYPVLELDGDALRHGEAVAVGCAQAFRFSAQLGLVSGQDALRAERGVAAAGLPVRLNDIGAGALSAGRLIEHMVQDKKAEGGQLTLILAEAIGAAFTARAVEADKLKAFLIEEGAQT